MIGGKQMDIESQPKMVGREEELSELKAFLDKSRQGHGNTVFIAGEAGVGKTRLLDELKGYAKEQGVDVLQGWSLYESLTPYMPFLEALRSGGLESLFADEAPRVEAIYLVSHNGMSIKEVIREETKLDPDIFTGMLTAVGDFVKDSLSMLTGQEEEGSLNSLGYKNYRILIETLGEINLAVILSGKENEFLINDMKEVLVNVDKQYGTTLKGWDGNEKRIEGIDGVINSLITSGKYDGIDYGKDDPKIKRNRLFENILLGIERHTKVNPSILCIEDLQWTDPSSLALMHYVARNTRKCNLLMLGTYRPEDIAVTKDNKTHPLINVMQRMSREDLIKKMELERIEENYLDEMLTSLLGKTALSDEFKNQLYKETEGNPFFIVSLIRMLIEEKTIEKKDDVWILTKDLKEANIPSKVHDVIVRRLNRVKEDERKTLDYASVIGEEFTSTILAEAIGVNRVQLLEQLRILEQKHKLIRSVDKKYKFDHAKIKEVLYIQIPAELRIEYHALIADAIETLNKDDLDEVVGDLAFHYYRCRNSEKALPYLIKAAEKAKKDYSNEEAITFYTEALELEEDAQKRMEIFESLGDVYQLIGDYEKSKEAYRSALEYVGEKRKKADIKVKIGAIHNRIGEYDEALRICTEALDLIKGKECKEEAFALRKIGVALHWKGESNKALEYFEKSLKIQEKIGDQLGEADTLKAIGIMYDDKGEFDQALENYKKSLKIYEKIGNLVGIAMCLNNIGLLRYRKGEYNESLEFYKKSLKIGEKIGSQVTAGVCLLNIGDSLYGMNEYDKALDFLEKSLKILEKINAKRPMTYSYENIARVYFKKKDLQKALKFCQQALDLSNEIGYKLNIATSRRIFGMIYKEEKKWKESMTNFEDSVKIFKKIGSEKELGDTYYEFALMWKAKGDSDKAKEHLKEALDIFEKLKLEKWEEKVKVELEVLKR
jgi:predicted ATPase